MARKPEEHTRYVTQSLKEIDAPWHLSHELYWNYREDEPVADYINRAIAPLSGTGRVPVLLTSLDPAKDLNLIKEILATKPDLAKGQTMLLRLCLNSEHSLPHIIDIIQALLKNSRTSKEMPLWWPLLQGDIPFDSWNKLRTALGFDWKYVNIALNPFMDQRLFSEFHDNIVVAQFFIGASEGIKITGDVHIQQKCDLGSNVPDKKYNVFKYAQKIKEADLAPISIICGPSLPEWTNEYNSERLAKFIPLYKKAVKSL